MKFNKQIAIILVLASLLLTSVGIAFYFWSSGEKIKKANSQLVTVYIAKQDIKRETMITEKHITKTTIAKKYVLTKPLLQKEIVGKYAKEPIYKNEMFLKEKLLNELKLTNDEMVLDYKFTSYNMPMNLFQNPNYALQPDDWINIVSVYSNSMNPDDTTAMDKMFSVQYVAKDIKVLGFLLGGKPSMQSIVKKKIEQIVKNKKQTKEMEVRAEELLLDIDPKVLLRLIDDYNKGKQLWVVKTKKPKAPEVITKNQAEVVVGNEIKKVDLSVKPKKSIRKYVKRSYPVTWYKPKETTSTKTALIEYANDPEMKSTKSAKIRSNYSEQCAQREKLLIGLPSKFNIRKDAKLKSKVVRSGYKNYILPYNEKSKIDSQWYQLCDGNYVHQSVVKEISFTGVLKIIEKQEVKK